MKSDVSNINSDEIGYLVICLTIKPEAVGRVRQVRQVRLDGVGQDGCGQ
jgi:hypothetical protein